jgi:NADH-quinone oxidoreductase subunit F
MKVKEVVVGLGSCGIAAGAREVLEALQQGVSERDLDVKVSATGCVGACHREPIIEVRTEDGSRRLYGEMTVKRARAFLDQGFREDGGEAAKHRLASDEPFFGKQLKLVLRNSGRIDPEAIEDYLAVGGYAALKKVLTSMKPTEVVEEVKASGLRGRGGAGFPPGLKWSFAARAAGAKKYMICNADEGDPGAFMDRSLLEGDPHAVLEGMIIAAYAIGADEGYIYVRAEYPLAIARLERAIAAARKHGFLGDSILGGSFSFQVHVKQGAGAFVCGEETALLASIEGKRGMPRLRPPFPAEKGLWGCPTNINNVETLANIPRIISEGAGDFAALGTEKSKGTKVFALAGKVKRGGMVEVPMGTTLREVIFDIGGGIQDNREFKAVQLGGPSGGCLPAELLDTPVDYDSLTATGAIMGSGGMIVLDATTCMVDVAKFFLSFTQSESCGKCTFCRLGTKRMLEILENISNGKGHMEDLDELEELALTIKRSSLCGLGQTAPNPVLTTLKYFRDEYEEHIRNHRCPAMQCKALIQYRIDPEICAGCTLCARFCPTQAASGEAREPHSIDPDICIRCGICYEGCRFKAIEIVTGVPK